MDGNGISQSQWKLSTGAYRTFKVIVSSRRKDLSHKMRVWLGVLADVFGMKPSAFMKNGGSITGDEETNRSRLLLLCVSPFLSSFPKISKNSLLIQTPLLPSAFLPFQDQSASHTSTSFT